MSKAGNVSHIDPVKDDKSFNVGSQQFMRSSFASIGEDYTNEHEQSANSESLKWMKSLQVIKDTKYLKVVIHSNFTRLISRTCPFADHGDLRAAIDLSILTFLVDDTADNEKTSDEMEMHCNSTEESRTISECRGERWTGDDQSAAFIMQSILDRCNHLNQKWMVLFRDEYIRYIQANVMERTNRSNGSQLTWSMFENTRYYAGAVLPFLYFYAAMAWTGDPSDVLATPHVHMLTRMAVNHICWLNDIISADKEKNEAVNNYIVMLLASNKEQTLEKAAEDAINRTNQECEAFLQIEAQLRATGILDNNEDVFNYIEILKYWMRGSLDWHFQSDRY